VGHLHRYDLRHHHPADEGPLMLVLFLFNNALGILGTIYLCSIVFKLARGYGFRRAFW
jgi:hypothetical protein